jgi:fibronectin-binding autotransporter adhesin
VCRVAAALALLVAARAAVVAFAGAVAFALFSPLGEAWAQALPPCVATGTNQTCTNSIAMPAGINDSATLTVTNTSTGTISGTGPGIDASTANVTNAGTITGSSRAINASTTVNLISNTGTIEATGAGGFAIQGTTINITANANTIRESGNGGSAIFGSTVNISGNTGRIEATAADGIAILIQTLGTATVNNLSGGVITGGRFGIFGNPGATLDVTNAAGATISGGIDGVGIVRNAGTITGGVFFKGATGTTNTLILQTGSVLDSAGGNIDPTNNLILQGTGTASNVFNGFDNLDVQASGTWVWNNNNSIIGATTISSGTLAVDGVLISPVTVNSGGTLAGKGTVIGNVSVAGGGAVAPGAAAPFSTLNVTGNVNFSSARFIGSRSTPRGRTTRSPPAAPRH